MIQLDDIKLEINSLLPELKDLSAALSLENKRLKVDELEQKTSQPSFWDDAENSKKILQQISDLKGAIEDYSRLCSDFDDVITMIELAEESDDESLLTEIDEMAEKAKKTLEKLKLTTLLTGEYDSHNAILTFHAGAGGTEAQDWVQMLYRMFSKWAEKHGFKVEVLDYLDGEEAGIKSASILISGHNAYGFLKSENGVHRLVRISPFDSSGRRHTSFASVEVMPEIDDNTSVEIHPDDIKMDVFRASGAGGQHVNKTSSAVRLTHIPTGIVASCQTQRSQVQNKDYALKMIKSKLIEIKEREHLEKVSDIKGEQLQIAWGAQIRSYVFMPYTLAKDHRTSFENGNINAVMDGDLDGFINAYLKARSRGEL